MLHNYLGHVQTSITYQTGESEIITQLNLIYVYESRMIPVCDLHTNIAMLIVLFFFGKNSGTGYEITGRIN